MSDEREFSKEKVDKMSTVTKVRVDLFRAYLGLPQYYNTISKSPYTPKKSEISMIPDDPYIEYYAFNTQDVVEKFKETFNDLTGFQEFKEQVEDELDDSWFSQEILDIDPMPHSYLNNLGTYETRFVFDQEKGEQYMSYYDLWDLDAPTLKDIEIDLDKYNFPIYIYGRIYESDFNKYYFS